MPRQPSPLLHVTNIALGLTRQHRNIERAWDPMLEQCHRQYGLVPTGPEAEALRQLLVAFAAEADLSPMGRYGTVREHVWPRLRNLAQVQALLRDHPAIDDERVDDPIFVVGMPRTATTLTHHLLAAADGHRGPLMAEMIDTRHHYTSEEWARLKRRTERTIAMLGRYESYFLNDIHPMHADKPEETFFCDVASRYFATTAPLPGYLAWLDKNDPTPWYRWLRTVLQVLQHDQDTTTRPRWVLKQPGHLWHLDTIRKVFPKATIVWTHRTPETVCGSTFSLVDAMRRLYLRREIFKPDQHGLTDIGDQWLHLLTEAVERGRTARVGLPRDAVVDVPYHWLTSDHERTVPLLYERLGMRWGASDQQRLGVFFRRKSTGRRHEYTTERYGKTLDEVRAAFGDYADMVHQMNATLHL